MHRFAHVRLTLRSCRRYFSNLERIYQHNIDEKIIMSDPQQQRVIGRLVNLETALLHYHGNKKTSGGWVKMFMSNNTTTSKATNNATPKGIYIHGSPGCGKSFLMDLFYESVAFKSKRRVHFNKFMLSAHEHIHKTRSSGSGDDPIVALAQSIYNESNLLCFDEFQVLDIADAMTIRRLFERLWSLGAVMVATSNRPPSDLYKNGLQRELFLPFIDDLQKYCEIIDMDSIVDYRSLGTRLSTTFFIKSEHQQENINDLLEDAWKKVVRNAIGEPVHIKVIQGRTMYVPKASYGCAWFHFTELCDEAVGVADYLSLTENFHTIFIQDIPILSSERRNQMRRFITLIDELYQAKVRLVASAEAPAQQLLHRSSSSSHDEVFAFDRCASRLLEMQSKEYLDEASNIRHKRKLPLINITIRQ